MVIVKDSKKIEEVLTRGVVQVLPEKKALAALMKKKRLRLYLGIDPTSPKLHLGHAILLRKLREFQALGHEAILLVGDFTAQIGDPSGRDKTREPLSPSQIKKNMRTYKKQAGKILNFARDEVSKRVESEKGLISSNRVKIKYNSQWLSQLKLKDFLKIASSLTVARLLERDMFQRRIAKKREIWLSEFLYPLLQGYDSVAMDVDLEIGATDQTFNMLIGRELQKKYHQKEKFVLTTPMLIGTDGRKMSKSYNNTINLTDSPREMYGKVMSLSDDLIVDYFELCTDLPLKEVRKIERELKTKKINPRDAKVKLAQEIVAIYHGRIKAQKAAKEFERVFKEKKAPSQMRKVAIKEKEIPLTELLVKTKLASSKAEAKRLVLQGGVKIDRKIQRDWQKKIKLKKGQVLQVGKRRFVKIA